MIRTAKAAKAGSDSHDVFDDVSQMIVANNQDDMSVFFRDYDDCYDCSKLCHYIKF